ncbi:MAG TPA: magnesium transporter [Planctomycetota bacterium]|nr:magnesium transporter [Planctomycetota bacterium]
MGGVQGFHGGALVEALEERTGGILAAGPDALPLRQSLREFLSNQNPIDIAQILGDLEDAAITLIFDHLAPEGRAVVLSEADAREQALLLMHVGEELRADLISDLDPDDAADVLDSVDEVEREAVLSSLLREDAQEIRSLRSYPADTAGGLMTPLIVRVPPTAAQADVLAAVRANPDAETINVIYVTDGPLLRGVVSIRDVLTAAPRIPVSEYMTTEVISVGPHEDQEAVIRHIETYHLGALPVVDESGRLLGVVTADDALTAQEEEASADVMAIAGAGASGALSSGVWPRVVARIPWLLLTLAGGLGAASIMRVIGRWLRPEEVEPITDLAKFMPLVAGLAGNIGMQSSAVMLRGFATGEIHRARVRRVIAEEILVAVLNGLLCGVIASLLALFVAEAPMLTRSLAIGVSIAAAASMAGIAGSVIPTLCDRLGIDPAISAGPFITTLNDILGFSVYMVISLGVFQLP